MIVESQTYQESLKNAETEVECVMIKIFEK